MLAMQRTKQLHREYASVAGSSEEVQKACVDRDPCVSMTPLKTRETDGSREAKNVEDGSLVLKSGAIKTLEKKCDNQIVRGMTERFGNISGQVGKMKVKVKPQNPRKQIMRNSFEQAESRRHLRDNAENKWFSDLHEHVNSATPNIYEI